MTQLAPELVHLIIKLALEDLALLPSLRQPSYSGFLNSLSLVSFTFSEICRIELFRHIHVSGEQKGNLLICELVERLGWEERVESIHVGIDQSENEGWCEDLIRILPNLKVIHRHNLQADVWEISPIKPDLQFLGTLEQLQRLTLQNAYHFHLPSTSLTSLTTLNLINTHLPCVQNLFKTSPIKSLSIINSTLPVPHRSLEILLTSLQSTLSEFSLVVPRHQVGINHLREIIYFLLPDLSTLRATPSFLFNSSGTGLSIKLPPKLLTLEIIQERCFGAVYDQEAEVKDKKVLRLLGELERLKELELSKEWCSINVKTTCTERDVGLVVR